MTYQVSFMSIKQKWCQNAPKCNTIVHIPHGKWAKTTQCNKDIKMSLFLIMEYLNKCKKKCIWLQVFWAYICMPKLLSIKSDSKGKGSGVWPSMVTHTQNLCSAFNPSKCTHTVVNIHLEQWAANAAAPGSSWGFGALLKGLTSVVVLRVERVLVIHSPHLQSLPDLRLKPTTFGLQVQLSIH